jgi:hypothetical protein
MPSLTAEQIAALLAKPERKPGTRTKKSKVLERDTDTWFRLNRELGSIIDGECTVPDCATLAQKGTRHAVTVEVPVNPTTTIRMCRRCYIAGVGKEDNSLDKS